MNDEKNLPEWVKDRSIPDWIRDRYDLGDLEEDEASDYLVATLVKKTTGEFPGRPFLNAFEIPDIGRLFLGELMVDGHTFRLTMLRLELGCRAHGSMGGPICLTNGVTKPPG